MQREFSSVQLKAQRRWRPVSSSGFTLLELLVVVSVLAALAGLTSIRVDSYERDAQVKLAQVEMDRIASVIHRFRADTGYYPLTGPFAPEAMREPSAAALVNEESGWGEAGQTWLDETWFSTANFSWLFNEPKWPPVAAQLDGVELQPSALMPWNMDAARGWHGPYLDPSSRSALLRGGQDPSAGDSCADLSREQIAAFTGVAGVDEAALSNLISGITDPFERVARRRPANRYCTVMKDPDRGGYRLKTYGGAPYLYETDFWHAGHEDCSSAGSTCLILRSLGPNSRDDGGGGDDLVLVLEKHS